MYCTLNRLLNHILHSENPKSTAVPQPGLLNLVWDGALFVLVTLCGIIPRSDSGQVEALRIVRTHPTNCRLTYHEPASGAASRPLGVGQGDLPSDGAPAGAQVGPIRSAVLLVEAGLLIAGLL